MIDNNFLKEMNKLNKFFETLLQKNTTINIFQSCCSPIILGNMLMPLFEKYEKNNKVSIEKMSYDNNSQYNVEILYKKNHENKINIEKDYSFLKNEIKIIFYINDDNQLFLGLTEIFIPFINKLKEA